MEEKCAGAYGEHSLAPPCLFGDEVDEERVVHLLTGSLSTGHKEEVDWRTLLERHIGADGESFRTSHRLT